MNCGEERDTTFLITQDSVGKLKRTHTIAQLKDIYKTDSIVPGSPDLKIGNASKTFKIYEKGAKHLLTVTASQDSVPKIVHFRIHDPRFVTEKGVGLKSTFKDIETNYAIRKIITSRNNVVLFIRDSDVYFTISKEELPASLRYAASTNIEAVQIPEKAKIKYMMVGWE
jgi:hypothetical protein